MNLFVSLMNTMGMLIVFPCADHDGNLQVKHEAFPHENVATDAKQQMKYMLPSSS